MRITETKMSMKNDLMIEGGCCPYMYDICMHTVLVIIRSRLLPLSLLYGTGRREEEGESYYRTGGIH